MLKTISLVVLLALVVAVAASLWLQARDRAQVARVRAALLATARSPARYDPAMVADLPEVARRYFARAIAPGTPLHARVRLEMTGDFILNGRATPMTAQQILAPPGGGFVWQARMGTGLMRFGGSDGYLAGPGGGESWTKFWLAGLIPLARVGGGPDHLRSAGARAMLESVWLPPALLPQAGAVWTQTGPDSAEVRFPALPGQGPMHLTLDAAGDPVQVWAPRWTDANPERRYRLQPFGGRLLATAVFDGLRLPVRVEMGNHWGTPDYAPFFVATVTAVRFD